MWQADELGLEALESAGDYLYGLKDFHVIRRWNKSTGAFVDVAGQSTGGGYADGTGVNVLFNQISGIATDGTDLWATDQNNHRLRLIEAAP